MGLVFVVAIGVESPVGCLSRVVPVVILPPVAVLVLLTSEVDVLMRMMHLSEVL